MRQAGASVGHEAVRCSAGAPLRPPGGSHMPRRVLVLAVIAPGDVERAWAYYTDDWSNCGGTRADDPLFMPLLISDLGDASITRELVAPSPAGVVVLQVAIWRRGDAIAQIAITAEVAQ